MSDPQISLDPQSRIVGLDALRGIAVAGIAVMNVIAFAMPPAAYINPRAWGGEGPVETALWAASFLLIEDKFRALFAMLFGAGVAILLSRESRHPLRDHYARMAVLLVIGLLHALLISNNEVLRIYAIAGLVLPFAMRLSARWLVIAAAAIMAAQLALSGWVAWQWLYYWWCMLSGEAVDPQWWQQAERSFGADPDMLAAALERGRESFAERIERRLTDWMTPLNFVLASLPSALAAMLLGMALWKAGLLAGHWERADALRLWRNCALIAVPVLVAMCVWDIASGFDPIVTAGNGLVWSAPFDLVLAVGYAALAMAVLSRAPFKRLAATGRMALTNYLGTSVIFAAMFAAWGLGLYGEVKRTEALLLTLVPIALMLTLSPFWLRRFRQGPAEWAWRSAAQGRMLPFRR